MTRARSPRLLAGFAVAAFVVAGFTGAAFPASFVEQPATAGVGGIGSVTSVVPGEGLSTSSGTCASGAISTTGTLSANCLNINQQTAASYTLVSSDCGKVVQFNRATAVTATLASASSNAGCLVHISNVGAGSVTIATAIDGVSNRVVQQYGGASIVSNGTAWGAVAGIPASLGLNGVVDSDQLPTATDTVKGGIIAGTCITMGGAANKTASVSENCRTITRGWIVDGGGSAIASGLKSAIYFPKACTITEYQLASPLEAGSVVVDLWLSTSSTNVPTVSNTITASAKPTLTSAQVSVSSTLTGWTVAIPAGRWLYMKLDTVTTSTHVVFQLSCLETG